METVKIESEERANRVKQLLIPDELMLRVFQGIDGITCVRMPAFPGLPDDVRVERVWYEASHRAFSFLVSHSSFDTVPLCCVPPLFVQEYLDLRVLPVKDGIVEVEASEAARRGTTPN